jgi:hypothetical protein
LGSERKVSILFRDEDMWFTFPATSVLVYRLPSSLFSALKTFVKRVFLLGSGSALAPTTVTVVGQPLVLWSRKLNKTRRGKQLPRDDTIFRHPKKRASCSFKTGYFRVACARHWRLALTGVRGFCLQSSVPGRPWNFSQLSSRRTEKRSGRLRV